MKQACDVLGMFSLQKDLKHYIKCEKNMFWAQQCLKPVPVLLHTINVHDLKHTIGRVIM